MGAGAAISHPGSVRLSASALTPMPPPFRLSPPPAKRRTPPAKGALETAASSTSLIPLPSPCGEGTALHPGKPVSFVQTRAAELATPTQIIQMAEGTLSFGRQTATPLHMARPRRGASLAGFRDATLSQRQLRELMVMMFEVGVSSPPPP